MISVTLVGGPYDGLQVEVEEDVDGIRCEELNDVSYGWLLNRKQILYEKDEEGNFRFKGYG